MGQTLALNGAPTTNAHNSGEVVVGASPVTLFAYTGNAEFAYDFVAYIERKVGSNWIPEGDYKGVAGVLTKARPGVSIFAPGTYRARKAATAEAIGFGKDEV